MATGNAILETIGRLGSSSIGVIAIAGLAIVIIIGIAGLAFYFGYYRRKFDIYVKVTSERADDPKEMFDKAAILFDKKNNTKYLRLLKLKVDLEAPPFKILRKTNWGDYIEIHRTSDDNFTYLTNPRIDKKMFLSKEGKLLPIKQMEQRFIENDIYWTIKRKQENKKMLDPESMLYKLLEHAPMILSMIVCLFMFYLLIQAIPKIFDTLNKILEQLVSANAGATTKALLAMIK